MRKNRAILVTAILRYQRVCRKPLLLLLERSDSVLGPMRIALLLKFTIAFITATLSFDPHQKIWRCVYNDVMPSTGHGLEIVWVAQHHLPHSLVHIYLILSAGQHQHNKKYAIISLITTI